MHNKLKDDTFCNTFKISLSFRIIDLDIRQSTENNLVIFSLSIPTQVVFPLNVQWWSLITWSQHFQI